MKKNYSIIKVFGNRRAAREFAIIHLGTIFIQYDYDDVLNRIVKQYVVKY